jgi:DNA-binding NtrC family response regulator
MQKVLIVEDDKDLNQAYQMILKRDGYEVASALNGKEALKQARAHGPQLILLDLLMPIMDGIEFLKKYDLDKHKDVKVLIFTNMENSPEVNEAYRLGAHRCIIKSWTAPQNLSHVVREALQDNPRAAASAKA